jgi:putative glutamine amidotransferase
MDVHERPVIGICGAVERARWTVWDDEAVLVPRAYATAVQRAGGLALALVPDPVSVDEPGPVLDLVDGLLLAGGSDLDPATYGQEPHPQTRGWTPDRDAFEIALCREALERDLPLLAVCRGMQVLNVARGGTLHQHLPDLVGTEDHRRVPGSFDDADHDVELAPGSLAARAAGETRHATKSHHHQGVDTVGDGLVVTGRSVHDGVVEALEDPGRRFALAVQWHPEADEGSRLIAALVDEARAARAR